MYTDPSGYTWGIFKPFVNAWNWFWNTGEKFAEWADENGIPSGGFGINSAGQTNHWVGDYHVNHNQMRVGSDEAIWGRTTVTFKNEIGQDGVNFTNNLGVSSDNVRVSYGNATNSEGSTPYGYEPDTHGGYGSLDDFLGRYKEWTFGQIMIKEKGSAPFMGYMYDLGPQLRYIKNPSDGKYVDMTHFLYVGYKGRAFGFIVEMGQALSGTATTSAFKRQDLYSNKLGWQFWREYGNQIKQNPTQITNYIGQFFNNMRVPDYSFIEKGML
ncbi:hypothetical protein SAMN06265379_101959 [Saccharicrinis carchari]|uniref:Uncharacterized protein n=1 Tax=Saccharicrinis carchari TaxID=1168039 RepID=A0A521BIV8_SACCC|nr:hypothetical protein [Saccharicrinis carchari]SMO46821.1 hypothetical protein SAMN06265379_101959 [Saccharicrinis carchari]